MGRAPRVFRPGTPVIYTERSIIHSGRAVCGGCAASKIGKRRKAAQAGREDVAEAVLQLAQAAHEGERLRMVGRPAHVAGTLELCPMLGTAAAWGTHKDRPKSRSGGKLARSRAISAGLAEPLACSCCPASAALRLLRVSMPSGVGVSSGGVMPCSQETAAAAAASDGGGSCAATERPEKSAKSACVPK